MNNRKSKHSKILEASSSLVCTSNSDAIDHTPNFIQTDHALQPDDACPELSSESVPRAKARLQTYGSRSKRPSPRSSSPSDLSSSPPRSSLKRPLSEHISFTNTQPTKRPCLAPSHAYADRKTKSKTKQEAKPKSLTQLHFSLDTTVLRTCSLCDLTYTKGAPDDENLHKAHCIRVQKGMEWGKDEDKECAKAGVREVACGMKLKDGKKGRIVCFKADVGGKIGSKVRTSALSHVPT